MWFERELEKNHFARAHFPIIFFSFKVIIIQENEFVCNKLMQTAVCGCLSLRFDYHKQESLTQFRKSENGVR